MNDNNENTEFEFREQTAETIKVVEDLMQQAGPSSAQAGIGL